MPWIVTTNNGRRFFAQHIESLDTPVINGSKKEDPTHAIGLTLTGGPDDTIAQRILVERNFIIEWEPF